MDEYSDSDFDSENYNSDEDLEGYDDEADYHNYARQKYLVTTNIPSGND